MAAIILIVIPSIDNVKVIDQITVNLATLPSHQIGNLPHRQRLLTPAIVNQ